MADLPVITHKELQRLGRLFGSPEEADLRTWEDQHIHEWLNGQLAAAYATEHNAPERPDPSSPQVETDRAWRYARAMADADDEDLMEWQRDYGRRARAAMRVADEEIAEALKRAVAA